MLNHSVSVILDHVAARGDSLIVWSLISKCDRRPLYVICEWHLGALPLGTLCSLGRSGSGSLLGLFGFAGVSGSGRRGDCARNKVEDGM